MKILHVTEAYGGGVTSAINTYVKHSAQFDHYLFACVRNDDTTGEENDGNFKKSYLVTRSLLALFRLRTLIIKLDPDVIHLHSSYAGFFGRLMPFIPKKKIVYTPHAFAFLRKQNAVVLGVYFLIEKLLAYRTQVIAGCGRDEMLISQGLISKAQTFELINICDPIVLDVDEKVKGTLPVVAMLGRVSDQKGYDYFVNVARKLNGLANFVWIGGGDCEGEELLRLAGVDVTGWAARSKVVKKLSQVDLYFHSAAWDGFPVSVLEAAALDIPIVLRRIGPFVAEGLNTVESIDDAVSEISDFIKSKPVALSRAEGNSIAIKSYHTDTNLQNALVKLYGLFEPQL